MRLIVCVLATATALFGFGCSGNKQTDTTTSTTTAPAATAMAAMPGVMYMKLSDVPVYPGAIIVAAGPPVHTPVSNTQGKIMSTKDSFDKVFAWYKSKLPPGSDKARTKNLEIDAATFIVGDPNKNATTISLSSNGTGKVTIGIAMRETLK